MTFLKLQVDRWAAWAHGLESNDAWLAWLRSPVVLPATEGTPPLAEMTTMMRRRLEPLGRVALQAAYWAQADEQTGPVVFASRWGEVARAVGMMQQLAAGEPLSPTAFSLSVHNAIGALYSIARKDRNNYQAVSAGEFSAEAGFAECAGLIADGAERALLVCFDGPLPELFAEFEAASVASFPHAFACLISRAEVGGISLSSSLPQPATADALPPGLAVLQFILGEQAALHRASRAASWTWTRHAG